MTRPDTPPLKIRTALLKDAYFWRHFHHLPDLPARRHGVPWHVEYPTLPIATLHCPYATPGEQEAPPNGLMGSVGWEAGAALGRGMTEMAEAIETAIRRVTADLTNPALQQVLGLRDRGPLFILSREQPIAFIVRDDTWWVREGVHRTIALALTGATELEGINLSSVRQAAG